jgi:hypothetical protein
LLGFLVLCLVNYLTRYYLFIMPFAVLLVATFFHLSFPANRHHPRLSLNTVKWPVFALLMVFCLRFSVNAARSEIDSEPRHLNDLAKLIHSEADAKLMARKPHLAYLANVQYENYPMVNSIPEMMASVNQLQCKYIYYGSQEQKYRPELKQLLKPESVSDYLIPVYQDRDNGIILYQTKQ